MTDLVDPCEVLQEALTEAHDLWHQAEATYHDPSAFRVQLNALIQASRNVTFRLQSAKAGVPDFAAWYGPWQDAMRDTPELVWLNEARVKVVKRSGLRPRSRARVEILHSYDEPVSRTIDVDPLLTTSAIARDVVASDPGLHDQCLVSITRTWATDDLPGAEILMVITRCIGVLEQLGIALQGKMQGEPTHYEPLDAIQERFLPPCMLDQEFRTLRINAGTMVPYTHATMLVPFDRDAASIANKRYRLQPGPNTLDLFDFAERTLETAKVILRKDGSHVTVLFLHRADGQWIPAVMFPADRLDKYVLWARAAEIVRDNQVDSFVYVAEAWTAPLGLARPDDPFLQAEHMKGRHEALIVHAERNDGEGTVWMTPFNRRLGRIRLERTAQIESASMNYANPVRRVWQEVRAAMP